MSTYWDALERLLNPFYYGYGFDITVIPLSRET